MARCLKIKFTKALLFYNEEQLIVIVSENVKVRLNIRVELCLRQLSHYDISNERVIWYHLIFLDQK